MRYQYLLLLSAICFTVIATSQGFTAPSSIGGTHSRDDIAASCEASGGSYWSNLDRYGCTKSNCDGKGGDCLVSCDNDGKCIGSTPQRTKPIRKGPLGGVTGILKRQRD